MLWNNKSLRPLQKSDRKHDMLYIAFLIFILFNDRSMMSVKLTCSKIRQSSRKPEHCHTPPELKS